MNVFFDTEFTGLIPGAQLISIGMISEDGCKFYAEFTDFDEDKCDEWVHKNVLENRLLLTDDFRLPVQWIKLNEKAKRGYGNSVISSSQSNSILYDCRCVIGPSDYIRDLLREWLMFSCGGMIQLVSDVCHYDMTLLCNLFGGAFYLPKCVNPACYDICQDMCVREERSDGTPMWYANTAYMDGAFEISREDYLEKVHGIPAPKGAKHNALYDAAVIKEIYQAMRRNAK